MAAGAGGAVGALVVRWLYVSGLIFGLSGVPYMGTPPLAVSKMMEVAEVGPGDVVADLGCGDGRIVIAAARRGARGVCVEWNGELIAAARDGAAFAGVRDRIEFRQEDLFKTDLRGVTVVALFLWPSVNERLRPMLLRDLGPGARVVSYVHGIAGWEPDAQERVAASVGFRDVFLWRVPHRGLYDGNAPGG
jgi:SAM-dependent methyltransferase